MTPRRVTVGLAAFALTLAACGGSDDGSSTTTAAPDTTTTVAEATTTTIVTTTTAPTTTVSSDTSAAPDTTAQDLPDELGEGTYVVGEEIKVGRWISDECGCYWATVDEAGNSEAGRGEDAIVEEGTYAVTLGDCRWSWGG